jgi:hypothetical protein
MALGNETIARIENIASAERSADELGALSRWVTHFAVSLIYSAHVALVARRAALRVTHHLALPDIQRVGARIAARLRSDHLVDLLRPNRQRCLLELVSVYMVYPIHRIAYAPHLQMAAQEDLTKNKEGE